MALISCAECHREISDKAASCPHCGCPSLNKTGCPPLYAITEVPLPPQKSRNKSANEKPVAQAENIGDPWALTPAQRQRLGVGIWAALIFGGLTLVASLTHRLGDQGVTLSLALEWAALVPFIWMALVYVTLADRVESSGLRKSALGAFGVFALGELLTVADLPVAPGWLRFGAWAVLAIGLVVLLGYVFSSSKAKKPAGTMKSVDGETAAVPADTEELPSTASKAGCTGVLAGVAFIVIKLGRPWLVHVGIKSIRIEVLQGLVGLGLLGALVGFVVWFAVSKIRFRERLGDVAALVGWAELLLLLAVGIIVVMALGSAIVSGAVADPDKAEKVVDDVFQQWLAIFRIMVGLGTASWAVLTAWLFATLRGRVGQRTPRNSDLSEDRPRVRRELRSS